MKLLMNTFLVCFLCAGVAFACPPDGAKASSTMEKSENAAMVDGKFASLDLNVKGMTCAGCENKVKAALGGIDGVVETKKVCSESDKASLTFDPSVVSAEEIMEALNSKTGYAISVVKSAGMTDKDAKGCSAECKKDCCAGKAKAKSSCTKAHQKASCAKSKASGDKELEKAK
ncbi:MAG: heavy-metal-associated domain-containing protein [Bacteroidetes bacterium]|nr:heavy-metal-associated domain-containing protein [Bacteroidota bacterium]